MQRRMKFRSFRPEIRPRSVTSGRNWWAFDVHRVLRTDLPRSFVPWFSLLDIPRGTKHHTPLHPCITTKKEQRWCWCKIIAFYINIGYWIVRKVASSVVEVVCGGIECFGSPQYCKTPAPTHRERERRGRPKSIIITHGNHRSKHHSQ